MPVNKLERFIERSKRHHGDRYDYSLVEYAGWNTKVAIICKDHGVFMQTPNAHGNGNGCPSCNGRTARYTTDSYKEAIHNKWGDSITLPDDFEWTNNKEIITYSCDIHGENTMQAKCLLYRGCSQCGHERKGGMNFSALARGKHKNTNSYVYFLKSTDIDGVVFYKVGVCLEHKLQDRIRTLRKYYPFELMDSVLLDSPIEARELEELFLTVRDRYRPKKQFHGYTECFQSQNIETFIGELII